MLTPYYADAGIELYKGDCREVLPELGLTADVVVADPPYEETSCEWDRWPDGWPAVVAEHAQQMWCFGSMRMFLDRRDEFARWKLAQDVVWEKHNGSGFAADRFKRVHENVTHWYGGPWRDLYRNPQREPNPDTTPRWGNGAVTRRQKPAHTGGVGEATYVYDGTRLLRSVVRARSTHGTALHPTEKPAGILRPLIAYSCPPVGLVLDPFAGSGSTLLVARELGMRAVGIEAAEHYCDVIARRLAQGDLFAEAAPC